MPSEETLFSDIRRRTFVGICTATYDAERDYPQLTSAPEELAIVRSWLCAEDLGERAFKDAELPVDPGMRGIEDEFINSDYRSRFREGDAVVVYATGHGVSLHDGGHRLILKGSDPGQLSTTLQTTRLFEWLKGTVRHALVVIDTCHAGQAIADLHAYGELPVGWLVLTTSGKTATAGQKVFAQTLNDYLGELRRAGSHGPVEPYLDAYSFVGAIREKLAPAKLVDHGYVPPGPSPCLPNPVYDPAAEARVPTAAALQELALLQSEIDAHWGPRARGVPAADAPGWFFTGRATILRRLVKFVAGPSGLLVVTGRAGCGKSAVLSRLVTFADPRFADEHTALMAAVPHDEVPRRASVDVAVVATGKRAEDVVQQIAGALGLGRIERPSDLAQALAACGKIVTVVIDALDESPEPERLAALLSDLGQTEVVRVVVGIRSSAGEDSEDPAPGPARALAIGWPQKEIAVIDREPWWSDADLTAYARDLLIADDSGASPYRDNDTTWAVADRLAKSAGRSFLLVRLTASSLAREPAPCDPDDPHLADIVDRGVAGVVADEMQQVCPDASARRRLVDLLVATAFAAGAGLPWHGIWPHVANAVAAARGEPTTVYGNNDVTELLGSRLGGYLARTLWHNVTVYRPFHESLAEALRSSPGMLNGTDEPAPDVAEVHRRILATLLPLTRPTRPEMSVHTVPYYVRRHLVDHALAAGTLADLLQDADALLTMHRAAILAASHTHDDMTLSALLLRLADLSAERVDERAAIAELRARQLSLQELADRFAQRAAGFPWRAAWADWHARAPGQALGRDTDEILALSAVETSAGSTLALVGRRSGAVEAWDLALGENIARWHPERVVAVQKVTLAELPDGPALVAAWLGGEIGVFQLTGKQCHIVRDEGKVTAMCLAERAGRTVCVTAHSDRRLVMRTLPQLDVVPEIRGATRAKIYGLAVVTHHGEHVLLSAGDSFCGDDDARETSMLRMWSLDDLSLLWEDHLERTDILVYIEKNDLIGRPVTVISQNDWGPFQLWDLNQGTLLLDGDRASNHAWAYEHDGKPFVVEASSGALTARHIEVRTDHEPPSWTLGSSVGPIETEGERFSSLVRLHGRATLLSATGGYLRVWDLQDLLQEVLRAGNPASAVHTNAAPPVRALTWGKERPDELYAATGHRVFALDAETGMVLWEKELRHERRGHRFIKALALTPPQDRLVAADHDGCLYVLDLDAKGQAKHLIKLGGDLEQMCIAGWQSQTLGFATLRQGGAWGVRVWDLDRREEVPTQSAYQLRYGEEDKVMRGLAVAPCATGVRFAFASTYGKVMVTDLGASSAEQKYSPRAYDEWHIPDNDGEYVNALATSRGEAGLSGADHALLLAAATEHGTIAIWNFLNGTLLAKRSRAHLGDIYAMQFGYRAGQSVLATGGDDGVLKVWTTGLDELLSIEIEGPIYALTFLGADRIAVGGQRGVLMLGLLEGFSDPSSAERDHPMFDHRGKGSSF